MGCCASRVAEQRRAWRRKKALIAPKNGKPRRLDRTTSHPADQATHNDEPTTPTPNTTQQNNAAAERDRHQSAADNPKTFFCGTDVSVEWLMEKLCKRFECEPPDQMPQWILERMNKYTEKDLDHTTVLRVTFGLEHDVLPKSVVLKISLKSEAPADGSEEEKAERAQARKMAVRMFKKECNAYEWLQKQRKAMVPKIFVIQNTPTEECNESVVVMEDIAERASPVEWEDEVSVEAVRDLLRHLAQIHAASRLQTGDWTSAIAENGAHFYKQLSSFIGHAVGQWSATITSTRMDKLETLTSASYLQRTVRNACKTLKCEPCLVHGNPISRNFFLTNRKEIAAIIDWTQVHPGCFGEDVAKAICWNLTPRERDMNKKKLLEFYHYSLVKYGEGTLNDLTMETVEAAYDYFVPLASVTYLMFLPEDLEKADPRLYDRAQSLINDSLVMMGMEPEADPEEDQMVDREDTEDPIADSAVLSEVKPVGDGDAKPVINEQK